MKRLYSCLKLTVPRDIRGEVGLFFAEITPENNRSSRYMGVGGCFSPKSRPKMTITLAIEAFMVIILLPHRTGSQAGFFNALENLNYLQKVL